MKPKLKEQLLDVSADQLLEIIDLLCDKYTGLEGEVNFLLNPKKTNNSQSYYNKLVKREIDTNSWSCFPNKGLAGLERCLQKVKFFTEIGNYLEAEKLKIAMEVVFTKCKTKSTVQNKQELKTIQNSLNSLF